LRTHRTLAGRLTVSAAVAACLTLGISSSAWAQSGGTGTTGTTTPPPTDTTTPAPTTPTTPTTWRTVPGTKAKLTKKGKAIPPAAAPMAVQQAIIAANKIRTYPYRYGGGHQTIYDSGYDCSGAVSYLLYHAGILTDPMPSGSFMTWGEPGKGQWITTYSNKGHMYAVVAGLRWDTSSAGEVRRQGSGTGPRWRSTKRKPTGFVQRHYPGF
jgi:hypothetical protein